MKTALTSKIPEEILGQFCRLVNEFSPEFLTCDGELSNLQVRGKLAYLEWRWREAEKLAGRKVSREEMETFLDGLKPGYRGRLLNLGGGLIEEAGWLKKYSQHMGARKKEKKR